MHPIIPIFSFYQGFFAWLGSGIANRGQIVIPAEARAKLQIEEGDKLVVLKGPREGSLIVFKIGSIDFFQQKVQEMSGQ